MSKMQRYLIYYPAADGIENCGFIREVDHFMPGAFDGDPTLFASKFMRRTKHFPTEPVALSPSQRMLGAVCLGVECAEGAGLTYVALREAADAYRRLQAFRLLEDLFSRSTS